MNFSCPHSRNCHIKSRTKICHYLEILSINNVRITVEKNSNSKFVLLSITPHRTTFTHTHTPNKETRNMKTIDQDMQIINEYIIYYNPYCSKISLSLLYVCIYQSFYIYNSVFHVQVNCKLHTFSESTNFLVCILILLQFTIPVPPEQQQQQRHTEKNKNKRKT